MGGAGSTSERTVAGYDEDSFTMACEAALNALDGRDPKKIGACLLASTTKVREGDGAWWLFIDRHGKRKAKRVGEGKAGKKAAELAGTKIAARLVLGGRLESFVTEQSIPERWMVGDFVWLAG